MYGQVQRAAQSADPGSAAPSRGIDVLQHLQDLGWVDTTALAVLFVFFVIGLFKGLFWQVSRIGILLVAYGVAGHFGGDVGHWLAASLQSSPSATTDPTTTTTGTEPGTHATTAGPSDTTLYFAYVFVFVAVVIVLSLVAMQIQKLVKKTGLGFFDRLGGGVFGIATGACTVLFLLFVVNMFLPDTALCAQAQASHSQRLSKQAIEWLGTRVPDELRGALRMRPLQGMPPHGEGPGALPGVPAEAGSTGGFGQAIDATGSGAGQAAPAIDPATGTPPNAEPGEKPGGRVR